MSTDLLLEPLIGSEQVLFLLFKTCEGIERLLELPSVVFTLAPVPVFSRIGTRFGHIGPCFLGHERLPAKCSNGMLRSNVMERLTRLRGSTHSSYLTAF